MFPQEWRRVVVFQKQQMPTSSSFKSGVTNFPLENSSLCIWWVMTGTRKCLDNNATLESGLVKEENTRLFHLHVTFHCPSFNGISKSASTSCFTLVKIKKISQIVCLVIHLARGKGNWTRQSWLKKGSRRAGSFMR